MYKKNVFTQTEKFSADIACHQSVIKAMVTGILSFLWVVAF